MDIIGSSRWGRATHSDRLERWLGKAAVDGMTRASKDFYYPIAVHGVPGAVYAMPGGDFCGEIRGGSEVSAVDRLVNSLHRENRARYSRFTRKQRGSFASLSAIITAATAGKRQDYVYTKTGTAATAIGGAMDMWTNTGQPAAGAAGGAAPGGTASTSSTTGALPFVNAVTNANTTHFVTGFITGSVVANTLLLYDRLFSVAKTMNSTSTEAVTGTYSRYNGTTSTSNNYCGGNFCFPSNPTTVLPATAHNWTVCQYTKQDGTTTASFPSATGLASCAVHQVDLAVQNWFMPLASGDSGIYKLTQMQCSALVATGTIDFVVGHPIAYFPCPVANMVSIIDGIGSAFNLAFIFDSACLAFLEMPKPAVTATTYSGQITTVSE